MRLFVPSLLVASAVLGALGVCAAWGAISDGGPAPGDVASHGTADGRTGESTGHRRPAPASSLAGPTVVRSEKARAGRLSMEDLDAARPADGRAAGAGTREAASEPIASAPQLRVLRGPNGRVGIAIKGDTDARPPVSGDRRPAQSHTLGRLNVTDAPFLARGDGVADDSGAIADAIRAANERAAGFQQVCLYLPGGRYRIAATTLPTFLGNGCLEGDGTNQTYVVVDRVYSGDVFSWDEAWLAENYFVDHGAKATLAGQRAGPRVEGLTVIGDTASPNIQNAFMFYDRTDFLYMRDVDALFLHGRCFATGITRNVRTSAMRESMLDATRFWACGTPTLPAVEIGSDGAAQDDATDEIDWRGLSIDASNGPGLVIRNRGGNLLRAIRIQGLRVEGPTGSPSAGDLIRIGDPAYPGKVADVSIDDLQTNASQAGYAALTITSPSADAQPYNITVRGAIGNGAGRGLDIEAGRGLRFDLRGIATTGTSVTVGRSPFVGSDILLNSWGQERFYTYSIDPSASQSLRTPGPTRVGDPSRPAVAALTANPHDGTAPGGLPAGGGAVDLQTNRSEATRVAAGLESVVAGGVDNRAGASYSVQVGGQSNVDESVFGAGLGGQGNRLTGFADVIAGGGFNSLDGAFSSIVGGYEATDRGRYGWQGTASGKFVLQGDAQAGAQLLRASGTSAMRLTADGTTARAGNCVDVPDGAAYGLRILLQARSLAMPAEAYTWSAPVATLFRGTGTESTRLLLGAATSLGAGSVTVEADRANGCLSLTFTPPSGGRLWHAVARVESVEVR